MSSEERVKSQLKMTDHYQILGLPRKATLDAIVRSYRWKAHVYRLNNNLHNIEWSKKKSMEVKQAYKVLSDESARRAYDQQHKVFIIHSEHDTNSAIYIAVVDTVRKNDFIVVNSCNVNSLEDAYDRIDNCCCSICLLTPNFLKDNCCKTYCTTACTLAFERNTNSVFYVKTESFLDDDIPSPLRVISGLTFPHLYFTYVLKKSLNEIRKRSTVSSNETE